MNVELNLEELEQIVEALNQKHDALSSGGTEVLPELQAVNRLYNRLRELREEHENNHDLSREEVHHAYNRVRGRQLGSAVFISDLANELHATKISLRYQAGIAVLATVAPDCSRTPRSIPRKILRIRSIV